MRPAPAADAYRAAMARRFVPDPAQLQVLLGTVLGRGRFLRDGEGVRFELELRARHLPLAEWTYERLAPLVSRPTRRSGRARIRSEPHPVFAQLAARRPNSVGRLLTRHGLWVWVAYERAATCEAGARRCECALRPRVRGSARSG